MDTSVHHKSKLLSIHNAIPCRVARRAPIIMGSIIAALKVKAPNSNETVHNLGGLTPLYETVAGPIAPQWYGPRGKFRSSPRSGP